MRYLLIAILFIGCKKEMPVPESADTQVVWFGDDSGQMTSDSTFIYISGGDFNVVTDCLCGTGSRRVDIDSSGVLSIHL